MSDLSKLSASEIRRYSKQTSLESFGISAQQKLKGTAVLLIGVGGVGSPAALFLTSMGVGKLGIVDNDDIELSNLPRQILYHTDNVGQSKVTVAYQRLRELNDNVVIEAFNKKITSLNEKEFSISSYDYILDGSDNFETKFLLNKLSLQYRVPLLSVSVLEASYQVGLFNLDNKSPCLSCVYPGIRAADLISCSNTGVLGYLPSQSSMTAINLLINNILNKNNSSELVCYDANKISLNKYVLVKDSHCQICSKNA